MTSDAGDVWFRGRLCRRVGIKRDQSLRVNVKQCVTSMGIFGSMVLLLLNVVLGRKHGADSPSAILAKVSAAYKKAGAAAGAPKILDFDVEVRIRGASLCLEGVGGCETPVLSLSR